MTMHALLRNSARLVGSSYATRSLSTGGRGVVELGRVIDRYSSNYGFLKGWTNFSASTLAVVQLRNTLPGFSVPLFKDEAARIYSDVGQAIASADKVKLRRLTTPSCYDTMVSSLQGRPAGQRHSWEVLEAQASVLQVRIGHHQSCPERRFAQITTSISAKLIWTIADKSGKTIGGVGSAAAPHEADDLWVFERCIAHEPEPPAWRLKERLAKTTS